MSDEKLVQVFKALGEPTRLNIVKMLIDEPHMACMDMTDELDINSNSTLSHHLKILVNCGLVSIRKEGTYRYYSANRELIEEHAPTIISSKQSIL